MQKRRQERFLEFMNELGRPIVSVDLLEWLIVRGFFIVPASVEHHGAYDGGLYEHSTCAAYHMVKMTKELGIKWSRPESPYIVGMFHDLCKIDSYTRVIDVPGKEMFGTGAIRGEEYHWEKNHDIMLKGHGDKSVMLLSQFMTLTEEEILCIRFHMGAYETDDWKQYDAAIRKYETVLWTHTADMYASKVEGV